MGEVWCARDTRLGRSVAIKVLPAELASSVEMRLRFEREAKTISQLNHPHICALFDVGENYLVMELLDGESLADRLVRGPLPLSEAMKLGAQIAEALDRAHRAGVVHRDLKPGNVMITKSGAKLLDFGLAKAFIPIKSDETVTQHKPLTQKGMVVGTLQYMAPEQLEGHEADARTDLFALGAVLYEMVTGKPAFDGETQTSLIAAILTSDPQPVSQLQPLTPPALERLIAKCLQKDPDERWQSAHDVAAELKWIAGSGWQAAAPALEARRTSRRERMAWVAALVAVTAVAVWLATRPRPRAEPLEAAIATEALLDLDAPPALSPDGTQLAYVGTNENGQHLLWIRSMARGTSRALSGTDYSYAPFWSADGRFVAFCTRDALLKKVPAAGGDVEVVARRAFGGGAWNGDGVILYTPTSLDHPIYRVSAAGGESSLVLHPNEVGAAGLFCPKFLPDGNHFIVYARGGDAKKRGQEGVWLATLDRSEKPRFLAPADSNAAYVEPGYLLFARDGQLRAQRFDAKKLRVTGDPRTLAPVQMSDPAYGPLFTASSSGMLVYQPSGSAQLSELVLKNRKGETLRTIAPPSAYMTLRISPDGKRVAVLRGRDAGLNDIWILGIGDGALNRFTFDSVRLAVPVWSSSGDEIAYAMASRIVSKRAEGSPRTIVALPGEYLAPADWSADGKFLAGNRYARDNPDAVVWSLEKKAWIEVAASPAAEFSTSFSPDGKWVVYVSDESGRAEVYVQAFPPTGEKHQMSTAGGMAPRWSRSGEIFWVDPNNRLNAAAVTTTPAFRAGAPVTLFPVEQFSLQQYDAMPDGTFVVNAPVRQSKPMTLVVNWQRRLEE